MFSSRIAPTGTSGDLDRPLLNSAEDDEDGGGDLAPIQASGVATVGVPVCSHGGYAQLGGGQQQNAPRGGAARSEEEKQMINDLARRRQEENALAFQRQYLEEEELARERTRREAEDERLARELQAQEENAMSIATLTVGVPQGKVGGQTVGVHVPGRGVVNVMIPHGLREGDTFTMKVPMPASRTGAARLFKVRIPDNVNAGETFRCALPTGRILLVGVPPGSRGGEELLVPYDADSGGGESEAAAMMTAQNEAARRVTAGGAPTNSSHRIANDNNNTNRRRGEYGDDAIAAQSEIAVMESASEAAETPQQRAEREAFLAALPPDVRAEVLAQETAQKRRLSAFNNNNNNNNNVSPPPGSTSPPRYVPPSQPPSQQPAPQLSAEQIALLESLPVELRAEVERDMIAELRDAGVVGGSTRATPPPSGEADLLGLGTTTMAAPSASTIATSPKQTRPIAPPAPSNASLGGADDMFSNLSIRGVSSNARNNNSNNQI